MDDAIATSQTPVSSSDRAASKSSLAELEKQQPAERMITLRIATFCYHVLVVGLITLWVAVPLDEALTAAGIPALWRVVLIYLVLAIPLWAWVFAAWFVLNRTQTAPVNRAQAVRNLFRVGLLRMAILSSFYAIAFGLIWLCGAFWWPIMAALIFYFLFSHHCLVGNSVMKHAQLVNPATRPELYQRLTRLAEQARVSLQGIYVVEPNPSQIGVLLVVSGRGRNLLLAKYVLDELTDDEINTLVASELCRDAFHHVPMLLTLLGTLLLVEYAAVAAAIYAWAQWQYGPIEYSELPAAGVSAMMLAYIVTGTVLFLAREWITQRLERQSDRAALRCARDDIVFASAFLKLAKMNVNEHDRYRHTLLVPRGGKSRRVFDRLERAKR
jgi:Zn-dependent protease with chaperone function